ncbi:MAG: DUF4114 domain-containing protein, partial [Cyanobacteria bacterium J06628_3]
SGANSDNFDHIKLLDNKTFGFEDLPNGGDQDFNDIITRLKAFLSFKRNNRRVCQGRATTILLGLYWNS